MDHRASGLPGPVPDPAGHTLAPAGVRAWPARLASVAGLIAALAAGGVQAQQDPLPEGQVDLLLSVEQSQGRYREADSTRIRTVVGALRYRRGPWLAEVQLPWLELRNPAGNAGLPDTVASGGRRVERGAGDILFKLGAELRPMDTGQTGLDLVAKWKTRSGSLDRGLGTGGTDLSLQLEAAHLVGRGMVFGHLGRRWTGDVPGNRPYRNPWYTEAGWSQPVGERTEAGAFVDLREPLGRLGPLGEATVFAAWRGGAQRVQLYLSRGFRDASADWALGVSIRTRY